MVNKAGKMLFFLLFICAGCDDPAAPILRPEVSLNITIIDEQFDELRLLFAQGIAENVGEVTIYYPLNCLTPVLMSLIDENGVELLARDPGLPPDCPPGLFPLLPGEKIATRLDLQVAWSEEGREYEISPGLYSIKSKFVYSWSGSADSLQVENEFAVELE